MAMMPYGTVTRARDGKYYVTADYGDTARFVIPRIVLDSLRRLPHDNEHVQFRAAHGPTGKPCAIDVRLPRPTRPVRHDDVAMPLGDTDLPRRGSSHALMPLGTLEIMRSGRAYIRPDRGSELYFCPRFVWTVVRPRLRAGDRVQFRPDRGQNGAPCTIDVRAALARR